MSTENFLALNPAQSVRRIAFDKARVVGGFVTGTYFLVVSGETACVNMDVRLSPLIYVTCPDYWGIEVVGSLLHRPQVLFLDEPTIGLDVTMQKRIRTFIAEYNRRYDATVLLTSHYMADVEALCKRVVVIHHGKILFDGPLARLGDQFDAYKTLTVELEDLSADLSGYGDVLEREDGRVKLRVPKADTARITARLLAERDIADLTVEDPPIEDVIELVFAQERPE